MAQPINTTPVIYVDRSEVHDGVWDQLKAAIRVLVAFVDSNQPQMLTYGVYLDEDRHEMTVVAVHPNSESLERHVDIGGPEFQKLAAFIDLREIETFGHLSDHAAELLRQKAAALGDRGHVTMHEQFSGFERVASL